MPRAAHDGLLTAALGAVMAGVLDNLYDRLGLWTMPGNPGPRFHAVRDWILLTYRNWVWPNFNLADSLLVCGAALLMWHAFRAQPARDIATARPSRPLTARGIYSTNKSTFVCRVTVRQGEPTMSGHDLDRVRADLATMQNALGVDLPYGEADVWFHAALAASGGVYAVLTWPNSPVEVTSAWSALPIFAAIGAYVLYLAVKSRRLPPREEARRREYKSGLIAVAVIVPAVSAYAKWAKYAGLTPTQGGGCLMAFMGATMFLIGVASPPVRYPRSLLIAPSLPIIAFGAFIPFAAPDYSHCLIGLMDMAAVGLVALTEHRHIRRHRMEGENHVGN